MAWVDMICPVDSISYICTSLSKIFYHPVKSCYFWSRDIVHCFSTAICRFFSKHCTLTNNVIGTPWDLITLLLWWVGRLVPFKPGLTTTVELLLSLQLTVLCRSAIVVWSKYLVAFLCCPLVFEFSVGIGVFVIGLSQISFFFSSWRTLSWPPQIRHDPKFWPLWLLIGIPTTLEI